MIPIVHTKLKGSAPETKASEELVSLFRSLLGAIAHTQVTQHQIACYVVALQRVATKLTIGDARKLNVLTKRLKGKPQTITYYPLNNKDTHYLTAFSDAGFKKEELDGYALRGAVYIRHANKLEKNEVKGHLLSAESRSIKTVCRSTYAAELMAATSAADMLIPMTTTLYEISHGVLGTEMLRTFRDKGVKDIDMCRSQLMIDAKSVYMSTKATTFKPPTEHSLSGHVLWLREMNEKSLIKNIYWVDTRDMIADGLTKGNIPRDLLIKAMQGSVHMKHDNETFARFSEIKSIYNVEEYYDVCIHCNLLHGNVCPFQES